ncbi:uncharacterized protein ASCRUDRAFT_71734 [Ascoidea rubescens DSM 1968]|uniref:Hyphally-regulated cell wall protein N-terminal domain-containing protein n=1 Tax=Ascoidea rubescens DSM 1968 TaxID=1344418 RepID=A0A1D2VD33_9ASCO|nr:hypothetical protein ASCRUDRAFT_71734 [Ascoidea rubescens DSM 1968]ODV59377.1 hypothetical protein ASCRUDRAFT_71734 [Ascoidea rubescens DSM 1968]
MFIQPLLFSTIWSLTSKLISAASSDIFDLYATTTSSSSIQLNPLGVTSDNVIAIGADVTKLDIQILEDGKAKIQNTNYYLYVNQDNQLTYNSQGSSIFFISGKHLHYNEYYTFLACSISDNNYEIYLDDQSSASPCDSPISFSFRPRKTDNNNIITSYVPSALGSTQTNFDETIFTADSTDDGSLVFTSDSDGTTGLPLTADDNDDDSNTNSVTTIYSTKTLGGGVIPITTISGDVKTSLSTGYSVLTYTSTVMVPVTETFTSKGQDTVIMVTTYLTPLETCITTTRLSTIYSAVSTETITYLTCADDACKTTLTSTLELVHGSTLYTKTFKNESSTISQTSSGNRALPTSNSGDDSEDDSSSTESNTRFNSLVTVFSSLTSVAGNFTDELFGNSSSANDAHVLKGFSLVSLITIFGLILI